MALHGKPSQHGLMPEAPVSSRRRWSQLVVSLVSTIFINAFSNGIPFLIPTLYLHRGLTLGESGFISALPSLGLVTTLIIWGYVVDRVGERLVLTVGSALTAVAVFAAAATHSLVWLGVLLYIGGMAAASNNSASGKLVAGWFPARQRGLAMGIRQTGLPLGVTLAALVIPRLADDYGVSAALLFPAVACAVVAVLCALVARNPPRSTLAVAAQSQETSSPYRGSKILLRIHLVSMLLVAPQYLMWTFMLVWLITRYHWSTISAGILVAVAQVLGSAARIAVGAWSDRTGSRLRPIRTIAIAGVVSLMLLAVCNWLHIPLAIAGAVAASVIAVCDNGLAFTAIVEIAGPRWSGRALGVQNTSQLVTAAAIAPLAGLVIAAANYSVAFAMCAVFPLLAVPLVPVSLERARANAAVSA